MDRNHQMELDYGSQNIIVQPVTGMSEARLGCHYVKQLASELNFTDVQREQIQIAVKEMTSNLIVHNTIDPSLSIYKVSQKGKSGIALVASDHGPGIASISNALADNSSTAGSMGCGLGAVRRLMDEFEISSRVLEQPKGKLQSYSAGGTIVVATKWCSNNIDNSSAFEWGGISRPIAGHTANGDGFYLKETDQEIFIVIVDGLGHGVEAEDASQTVFSFIKENLAIPFEKLLPMLHEALRGSRGAAMMSIRLNKSKRTMQYAGIGNIEAAIIPRQKSAPLSRPGVLGSGVLPSLFIKTIPWPEHAMLILHTDGISRRWSDDPNIKALGHNPLLLSHFLLRDYGRHTDDATVLILREKTTRV